MLKSICKLNLSDFQSLRLPENGGKKPSNSVPKNSRAKAFPGSPSDKSRQNN